MKPTFTHYAQCLTRYVLLLAALVMGRTALAQTTLNTPVPTGITYVSDTETGVVIFGVKNNNATDVVITGLASYVETGHAGTYSLWYHTSAITGVPPKVTAANGWIELPQNATITATATGVMPILSGLSLTLPAGSTYRLALVGPIHGPFYGTSGSTGNIVSGGGVDIYLQNNPLSPTYAATMSVATPNFTPRSFYGSLTFVPANACTGTPTAGDAVIANKTTTFICPGQSFTLDLFGNSIGTGQTYRWQSSTDNASWNYISTASTSPIWATTQTTTRYYRCEVTCGAAVAYSNSIEAVSYNLSGNYTINKNIATGGNNFASFNDAVAAMNCGIAGPVTFTVEPGSGPYDEQVSIPAIPGASAVNRITFRGNGEVMQADPVSATRYIIKLDGAKYVTIDSLQLLAKGSVAASYGWGVHLTNGASYDSVKSCNIVINSISTTESNSAAIVVSGSATSVTTDGTAEYNTFINNTLKGGYNTVIVSGLAGTPSRGNQFINNSIQDFYANGITLTDTDSTLVRGNDISRSGRVTVIGFTGIELGAGNIRALVDGNKIHDTHNSASSKTGAAYAIASLSNDATAGNENKVVNNLVYHFNSTSGTIYALYNSGSDGVYYYHNTVVLDEASATSGLTRGFYQVTAASNIQLINNIVYIARGGTGVKYCVYFGTTTSTIVSNNNVLYNIASAGTNGIGSFGTTGYGSLAQWQGANSGAYDQQSINVDPMFAAIGTDFTPTDATLNNSGVPVGVLKDINGSTRSTLLPDPGAYEFDIAGIDAAISWEQPVMPAVTGLQTIKVKVTNVGSGSTINTVNLSYTDGTTVQTQSFGSLGLLPLEDTVLQFNVQYNITGNTHFRAYINTANGIMDLSQANDTAYQSLCFPMSGTYTINAGAAASSTNFTSFGKAALALSCGGVNGAVVINVVTGSGPYNERFILPQIAGASTTNTITINGHGETLSYSTADGTSRSAVLLDGTDHIIIDSLNINTLAGSGEYCWGILLTNQADSNIIRKCTIDVSTTITTAANHIPIIISGSTAAQATTGNNGNYNLITQNVLKGGYYGVYVYGNATAGLENSNNHITRNTIQDFYLYGIYEIYNVGSVIDSNNISRPTRTNTGAAYGIYLGTRCADITVAKNRIHNMFDAVGSTTSGFYGIYLAADATAGKEVRVLNNAIYNIAVNTGFQYGIYNSGVSYCNIYHNTISLDDVSSATTGVTRGFYQSTASTNINFVNNIINITRGGTGINTALYFNTATSTIVSNNNALYVNGTGTNYIGYYDATSYANLTDWKAANSNAYDQASVSANPQFVDPSTGDLHPTDAAINNIGANVGVATDLTGVVRGATPDPGAFEFSVAGIDAAISWISPASPATAGLNTITVQVLNNSTSPSSTITAIELNYTDGINLVTQTFSGLSIAAGATQQLSFTTQYNLQRQAQFRAYISLVNGTPDISQGNDTALQTVCVPMSGAYTISSSQSPSATVFNSFTEAITALTCTGIAGPVTFTVEPGSGPYDEQIVIPAIQGASAVNRITFRGNGATLQADPVTATRYLIRLDGAQFITLDSLELLAKSGTSTSFGWGIHLTNGAAYDSVKNCKITINSTSTTESNSACIVVSGSPTVVTTDGTAEYNTFIGNTLKGGYNTIIVSGTAGSPSRGNQFINNIIQDFYANGITMTDTDSTLIKGNDISRSGRTAVTTFTGVELAAGNIRALVDGNKVHDTHNSASTKSGAAYGIASIGDDATAGNENKVVNNLVYNFNSTTGTIYGLYNSGSDGVFYYHNTVVLDDVAATSGLTRGFFQTAAATNIYFRNNIVYIARGGTGIKYCVYLGTTTSSVVSNNNVLYNISSAGTNGIGSFGTTGFADLTQWKTANSNAYDQQSISVDPAFTAPGSDFTPTDATVNNAGVGVGVLTDINGTTRSIVTPDPGAYEYTILVNNTDMKSELLVTPQASAIGCYNNESITVRIKNISTDAIDFAVKPATVSVLVSGAATFTTSTVVNTGSLASGATTDIVLPASLNMTAVGLYNFAVVTKVPGDANINNDTFKIVIEKKALNAGTLTATPNSFCYTGGIPVLTVADSTGAASIQWQSSITVGTGFSDINGATTSPYTVTAPITQTTYYRLVATCGAMKDTATAIVVALNNPQVTAVSNGYTCGTGTVTLGATGTGSDLYWYANATGGSAIATGNTFTTPSISSTTNYYVSAGTGVSKVVGGRVAPLSSATATTLSTYGLVFTVTQTVTIDSVQVFKGTGTALTISLYNSTGSTQLLTTGSKSVSGASPFVTLGWTIEPGTYRLAVNAMSGSFLRDGSGTTYPIALGTVGQINGYHTTITGSLTTGAAYYFLYNWHLSVGCESVRTQVIATVNNDPGCNPVPVSLLAFNGERRAKYNYLTWSTANETNNAGFEVQRSIDGNNFKAVNFVATKASNGNSTTTLQYNYTDETIVATNGYYYRLKQVDKDGKSAISKAVFIKGDYVSKLELVSVYPNPAKDVVNVSMNLPKADNVTLIITDMTGKVISTQKQWLATGNNVVTYRIQQLSQGTYLIKAVCADGCETAVRKFVKD